MLTNISTDGRLLNHHIRLKYSQQSVCGYKQWEFISDQIDSTFYAVFAEFNYIMGERLYVL
jgi:hypothetical protein